MAVSRVGGVNGSVTMVAGHNADFAGFDLEVFQDVADDTSYTDTWQSNIGGGVSGYRATARGFLRKGAASASPGLAVIGATGGTATFQLDTGVTVAGTFIVERISLGNAKRNPASGVTFSLVGDGAATETWSTGS